MLLGSPPLCLGNNTSPLSMTAWGRCVEGFVVRTMAVIILLEGIKDEEKMARP